MSEGQCMHIVVQDPKLVIRTSHECLGLLHLADSEFLFVYAFESAIDHSILLTLCLKNTLVQINVLHTHSLPIDYYISRNTLCRVVYHVLLINQTIYLGSESNELGDAMSVVLILEDGTWLFLVEVEKGCEQRELALVNFLFLIVHELSIEVTRVIEFREVK